MSYSPTDDDLWGLSDEAREFITFVVSNMNRSYKPVMLLCMLDLADEHGCMSLEALASRFHSFYLNRERMGVPVERMPCGLVQQGQLVDAKSARHVMLRSPLHQFCNTAHAIRNGDQIIFTPVFSWDQLEISDMEQFRRICSSAIEQYYLEQ